MCAPDNAKEKLFRFSIGQKLYALPVSSVERVASVPLHAVFQLPFGDTAGIRGVFNFRGTIIAIADIPTLRVAASDASKLTVVLLRHGETLFGLPVERVYSFMEQPSEEDPELLDTAALYAGKLHK